MRIIDRAGDWIFTISTPFRVVAFVVFGIGYFIAAFFMLIILLGFIIDILTPESDGARWCTTALIGFAPLLAVASVIISFVAFWISCLRTDIWVR